MVGQQREVGEPGIVEDAELVVRIAELRAAIAGDVTGHPDDFAATHAAHRRLFVAFHLRPVRGANWWAQQWYDDDEPVLEGIPAVGEDAEPDYLLEPEPRSDAVVLREGGIVILPVPLGLRDTTRGGSTAPKR